MLKAGIIGTGNIAQGYDNTTDENILTHIKGYKLSQNFIVQSVFDIDKTLAVEVAKKWDIPNVAESVEDLAGCDVISICTPDETHEAYLGECLKLNPKAVFCEKPISRNFENAEKIVKQYSKHGISLFVNYSRRFVDVLNDLKNKFAGNGKILSARIKYYKGFFHNCSHFIDLLSFYFEPEVIDGYIVKATDDFSESDKTISGAFLLSSDKGDFTLTIEGYDSRQITPLELELVFEKKQFIFEERGGSRLLEYTLAENKLYPGYFEFEETSREIVKSEFAMKNAIVHIYHTIVNGGTPLSTGETALKTLKLCNDIYSFYKGK